MKKVQKLWELVRSNFNPIKYKVITHVLTQIEDWDVEERKYSF